MRPLKIILFLLAAIGAGILCFLLYYVWYDGDY